MAKDERFESRLSTEGRAALERLAGHHRISKAAVVEMLIADAERQTFFFSAEQIATFSAPSSDSTEPWPSASTDESHCGRCGELAVVATMPHRCKPGAPFAWNLAIEKLNGLEPDPEAEEQAKDARARIDRDAEEQKAKIEREAKKEARRQRKIDLGTRIDAAVVKKLTGPLNKSGGGGRKW